MIKEASDHHVWPIICSTLLLIVFLAKFLRSKAMKNGKDSNIKLPPGRRGWPIIGDSISWYNAVASSHPPRFVEQQVQRYIGPHHPIAIPFGLYIELLILKVFADYVFQNFIQFHIVSFWQYLFY